MVSPSTKISYIHVVAVKERWLSFTEFTVQSSTASCIMYVVSSPYPIPKPLVLHAETRGRGEAGTQSHMIVFIAVTGDGRY